MSDPNFPTVVFQNAGTTTSAIDIVGQQLVGFYTPAALTSTAITLSAATTLNGTYKLVKSSSATISFTVTTNSYYGLSADQQSQLTGVRFLKLIGGSSESQGVLIELALVPRRY